MSGLILLVFVAAWSKMNVGVFNSIVLKTPKGFGITLKQNDKKQLPDIKNSRLFCSPYHEYESWHYLPRHLSAGEFFNPYKALKKLVPHIEDTSELLNSILHYALSGESLADEGMDTLQLNLMLQKLLEAAHLLYVRTAITNNDTTTDDDEME